jgi:uncharacterized membrane protein YuzA (DUF378 family)
MNKNVSLVAMLLVVVGALNWGLVGFFDYNLVGEIFGSATDAARVVYALVGLAGVYQVVEFVSEKK